MRICICIVALLLIVAIPVNAKEEIQTTATEASITLDRIVPDTTLLYVSIPNAKTFCENWDTTINAQFMHYFLSDEFHNMMNSLSKRTGGNMPSLKDQLMKGKKEFKQNTGISFNEFKDLFSGELALSVINVGMTKDGQPNPKIIVKIDWNDKAKAESVLHKTLPMFKPIKDGEQTIYEKKKRDLTFYYVPTDSCLIFATDKKLLDDALEGLRKAPLSNSLAQSQAYQSAISQTYGNDAIGRLYFNYQQTLAHPLVQMGLLQFAPDLTQNLGIQELQSVTYAMQIKNQRMHERTFFQLPKAERKGLMKVLSTSSTETTDGICLKSNSDLSISSVSYVAVIASIAVPRLMRSEKLSNEGVAVGSLKMLRDMNAQFKQEDPDRNATSDFWTADVSGFYRTLNGTGTEIDMIPLALARADAAPIAPVANYIGRTITSEPVSHAGYLFRAMVTDENGKPYNLNNMGDGATTTLNPARFAFCAYPEVYGETGTNTFIVNQEGTVWRRDLGRGAPITVWPADALSEKRWSPVD